MTELAFLGSLLGMPSIFDPMFPATYSSFFGSYPPWMKEGVDKMKEEVELSGGRESRLTGDDNIPVSPVLSNVSLRRVCIIMCKPNECIYMYIIMYVYLARRSKLT